MSRNDAAILGLRLLAIFAWFQALEFLAGGALTTVFYTMTQLYPHAVAIHPGVVFLPSVVFLAAGFFLFAYSHKLASRFFPAAEESVGTPVLPGALAIASAGFAIVGLAIFLYALPRVLSAAFLISQIDEQKERVGFLRSINGMLAGAAAVQVALGFLLFRFSHAFATVWWRKQTTRVPTDSPHDQVSPA